MLRIIIGVLYNYFLESDEIYIKYKYKRALMALSWSPETTDFQ
jgi:hypothetical protein